VRRQLADPEGHRRGHVQRPGRLALDLRELGLGGVELLQHAHAMLVEPLAGFGDEQASRRAIDEASAERGLERRHVLADRGRHYAGAPRDLGEALQLDDAREDPDRGQVAQPPVAQPDEAGLGGRRVADASDVWCGHGSGVRQRHSPPVWNK